MNFDKVDKELDTKFPFGLSTDIDTDVTDEVKSFLHKKLEEAYREGYEERKRLEGLQPGWDSKLKS